MLITALLALAAEVPDIPTAAVQIMQEGHTLVMRTLLDNKPLYTYDKDEPGKSNCVAQCATQWPPLWAPKNAMPVGKWTVLTRADGSNQWVYNGKPVYGFAKDKEGTASGDGMGGVWHLLPTIPAD